VRVLFQPGAMFKVPVGDDDFAYAVMLARFPFIAFYHKDAKISDQGAPLDEPMFVLHVAKTAYSTGRWGRPIRKLAPEDVAPIPRFFWQSPVNKNDCKVIDPERGRITASPSECEGLESSAVWAAPHIESRIADEYAGRPNMFVESLKLKL
jgi:hypothetical protein